MDVLPAHLNRDSFRDSLKGLVALEIIRDLLFDSPINNIMFLTLLHASWLVYMWCDSLIICDMPHSYVAWPIHIWNDSMANSYGTQKNALVEKIEGSSGIKSAQKSRKSCALNDQGCGCIGTVDSRRNLTQSYDQIQTLKEYACCHIYCVQLCAHFRAIVTSSCSVSNRKSRYPRGA